MFRGVLTYAASRYPIHDQCLHFEGTVVVESFEVVVELMRERRDKDTAAATVAVGYFTVSERVRASWRGFRH